MAIDGAYKTVVKSMMGINEGTINLKDTDGVLSGSLS